MNYLEDIRAYSSEPQKLEELYQQAVQTGKTVEFENDLIDCYQAAPENLLFQAWYYRFHTPIRPLSERKITGPNWKAAIPLAILNGLLFWALSEPSWQFVRTIPYLMILAGPLAAILVIAFLTLTSRQRVRRALITSGALVLASLYVLWAVPNMPRTYHEHAAILLMLHLALLAWIAVGITLIGIRSSSAERFGFLIKSLEVFITGGLYGMAIGAFSGITMGMFAALGIELSEIAVRFLVAGGAGLVPVIAVASIYDPRFSPFNQDFRQGLSRFIANMMRLLLPLTLLVLIIYLGFIPFNFMQPFQNRDVLIIYNAMLFAIMALLVGATPIRLEDLTPQQQKLIRGSLLTIAILAILISLYALSAIVYRTVRDMVTINRLAVIGWNTINILLLVTLVLRQFRRSQETWVASMYRVFGLGAILYTSWGLFILLAVPIFFR